MKIFIKNSTRFFLILNIILSVVLGVDKKHELQSDDKYYSLFDFHKDFPLCNEQDIELLTSLKKRSVDLDEREKSLLLLSKTIEEYIAALDDKYQHFIEMFQKLENLIELDQKILDAEVSKLAKIYSAMDGKDVAKIFNELDMKDLLPIIRLINESDLTEIFAKMKVDKVKLITEELSKSKKSMVEN